MWVRRITMSGLMALLVAGAAGAARSGDAPAIHRTPDCTPTGFVLSQAPDGHVDACLRLGDLAAGPHTISLQDVLAFGPPPRRFLPPGSKQGVSPTPPPSEPAVSVTLSPASGGPGTVVAVTVRLKKPFAPGAGHPNLCWDGCQNGLTYGDVTMRRTSPTSFRTRIVIPAAPWIEGGPAHVARLASGDYAVAIQCLRAMKGCPAVTEGSATFHLHVMHPVTWCPSQRTCARLRVRPSRALPGELVHVTGFVPLAAGPTANAGTPYELVVSRRRPHTPQVRFAGRHGVRFATAGLGAVGVTAAPRYASLKQVTPLGQVSDGVPQIAADPAAPGMVAWCAGQTIAVSGPAAPARVPSATAKPVLQAMGFSFRDDSQPECASVAPLATAAGAPVGLAAAFTVTESEGPPFHLAALMTHDNGQTWAPIPVPAGSGPAGFGGFRYGRDGTLQAVFGVSLKSPTKDFSLFDSNRAVTELASADGQSWSQAPLGCPPAGPCVTFGLYQPGNCAMNGTTQTLLRSTDGGSHWSPLEFPYPIQSCREAQLVATSPRTELLVDSASTYPVLRTVDGGATWHDVGLPRRGGDGNLSVLPDGSLLMADGLGYAGPWKLLARGRGAWCALREPAAIGTHAYLVAAPTVVDGRLWWLTGSEQSPNAAPAVHEMALSALRC